MSLAYPSSPSGRLVRFLDVAIILWTASWVILGFVVAGEVRGLTQLSDTVVAGGKVLKATGRELSALEQVPFVGDPIRAVEGEVNRA